MLGIVAATWYWLPSLGFTGIDMGPLLLANRIEGIGGLLSPFFHEIRAGIEPGVAFYRPWTGLSYGIDLALFGLRPGYFHIIDIVIHLVSTGALLLLMRRLGVGIFAASLAALWFGAHPLAVEVVPAAARRADLWAVMWLLVACLGALGRERGDRDGMVEKGEPNGGAHAERTWLGSRAGLASSAGLPSPATLALIVGGLLAPLSK